MIRLHRENTKITEQSLCMLAVDSTYMFRKKEQSFSGEVPLTSQYLIHSTNARNVKCK